MRNRIRELYCKAFYGLLLGAVFHGAMPVRADSEKQPSALVRSSDSAETAATPMADRATVAPYAVRLRITGFLARQHAREGNTRRSLVEFYSMLNVDDPAWPDDEQGDAMRVTRDVDVAQMMTEAGFYDHAIRILQTSLILACVNHDPQATQIEFQMQATAELARLKGVPVPDIDMSFLNDYEPVRPASSTRQIRTEPANPPSSSTEILPDAGPAFTGQPVAQPPQSAGPPNELPRRLEPISSQDSPMTGAKTEDKTDDRSRWTWWSPSRWRQKKDIAPAVSVQEDAAPERPTTSPSVAPTYCQECSGLHGYPAGNVVVRYNPRTGITHTHLPGGQPASPMPSPYQKQFAPLQPEGYPARGASAPPSPSRIRRGIATEQPLPTPPSNSSEAPTDQTPGDPDKLELQRYDSAQPVPESSAKPAQPVQQTANAASDVTQEGPALTAPPLTEPTPRRDEAQTATSRSPSARTVTQIGVAGEVANPGIFTMQGRSTTLAALLRRTGEHEIASAKKARILRAVEIREGNSTETLKDFYCQRLDGIQSNTQVMETPIYGQELVIVDGAGEKPIYLAVMPHFILQVPVDRHYAVTTEQIIEQLAVHWPNVRNQSIGVLRYEQWGSAVNVSRLAEGDPSALIALTGGDVVYVDGSLLDRAQVIAAAESIAKMAGARLRKHESATQR